MRSTHAPLNVKMNTLECNCISTLQGRYTPLPVYHYILCTHLTRSSIIPSIGIARSRFSSRRSCCEQCTAHTLCVREITDLHSPRKPKNARSKRALEAREPKEIEDPRTVIFVKGTHTGERLNAVMQELVRRECPLCPPSHH